MLCASCERDFNRDFEGYIINSLRRIDTDISNEGKLVHDLDNDKLFIFAVSVVWRASVSRNPFYRGTSSEHVLQLLRLILKERNKASSIAIAMSKMSVTLKRATFHDESIRKCLSSQVIAPVVQVRGERRKRKSVAFAVQGFCIEVHFYRIPTWKAKSSGLMLPGRKTATIPKVNFLHHKLFHGATMVMMDKAVNGKMTKSVARHQQDKERVRNSLP
jgi:hypothetical protein